MLQLHEQDRTTILVNIEAPTYLPWKFISQDGQGISHARGDKLLTGSRNSWNSKVPTPLPKQGPDRP